MKTLIESQAGDTDRRNRLVNVLTTRQSAQLRLLIGLWLIATIAFSLWWLQPAHWTGLFRFAFNSFILAWSLVIPGYYFYFLSRMKKPNPKLEIPSSWRIAMITTRAPSEPFAQVKQTLLAMKAQMPPHDTWLADEDPTPEILNWCAAHGVFVSCRKGVPGYHNDMRDSRGPSNLVIPSNRCELKREL